MMPLVEWTDELSVNVREIDEQHKQLVKLLNDLDEAMKQGKGKDVLHDIIGGLAEYTNTHFGTEEKYFEEFKYSESFAHNQEHKVFVQKVGSFKKAFEEGDKLLSIEVMIFMGEWLVNHIMGSDKKYAKCFHDNGLT